MPDGTLAQIKLTAAEIAYLQSFLDAGDRPGFYMAYYAMVEGDTSYLQTASDIGKDEASLQAKISSFSSPVGAAAFLSNRILQQMDAKYPGIYTLSQQVAQHALDKIKANDNKFVSDAQFFDSAEQAWKDATNKDGETNLLKDFPGLLLENGVPGLIAESTLVLTNLLVFAATTLANTAALPDRDALMTWLQTNGGDRVGEWVAALAGLYVNAANVPGKDVDAFSGMSGYTIVESVDGEQRMAVQNSNGHVVAVELDEGKLLPSGKSQYEAMNSNINTVIDLVMGANPIAIPGVFGGKAALAAILDPIFGGAIPWSDLTSPVGDDPAYNPATTNTGTTPAPHRSTATTESDTISGTTANFVGFGGNGTIHALAGNDVVFGGSGNDELFGDADDDILWGQGDDDKLDGGSGNNILRGGEGYDTAIIDGGPVSIDFAPQFGTLDFANAEATATVGVGGISGNAVDTLFGIERFKLSNYSDTAQFTDIGDPDGYGADVTVDFGGASEGRTAPGLYHLDDDKLDFSATGANITTHSVFGDTTSNYGVIVDLSDTANQTVQLHKDKTPFDFLSGSRVLFKAANANSVIGTNYDDELRGNGGKKSDGEGYSTLRGGLGNDTLIAAGWESHLYGGQGADSFGIGSAAYIDDADTDDKVYMGPFRLVGGVNQWWQESGYAYYAPFSLLQTAFPVVGIDLISLAAVYADIVTMQFARYRMGSDGTLLINIGWGFGGNAAVKNYSINMDSGKGTAGISVFSASITTKTFSWDRFEQFINLSLYAGFGHGIPGHDPLVLDLGGDGYQLTTEANSSTWFDFNQNGYAQRTGWVGATDGLLVRDLNSNGKIDDASELFGDASQSGFDMLAAFDGNNDGAITAADAVYASLQVWQDKNLNGITDTGELKTLADLGIVSISLAATAPATPVSVGQNQIAREASFTLSDGTTHNIADVVFDVNTANTHYLGDTTVDATAAILPQLTGFGTVKDLRVAMTQDAALKAQVSAFVANTTTDLSTLKDQAEAILYNWADVQGVAATAIGSNGLNARKLAFLEKYAGTTLMPRDALGAPTLDNVTELEQLWNDQLNRLTLRLVVQGPLASTFAGLTYHSDIDLLVADGPNSLADVLHRIIVQLPADGTDATAMWTQWAPLLGAVSEGMVRADANVVRNDYLFTQLLRAADGVAQPLSLHALAQGLGIPDLRFGTDGNDTLARGEAGITATYYGGGGDDVFNGGTGQDVYVFGHTVGHAIINDVEANPAGDRIRFAFLTPDDVSLERDGNDLLITVTATGETVRVIGQFAPVVPMGGDLLLSTNKGIEDIQFADGSIMETPEIMAAVGKGSDGDDHLVGTMHADALIAGKGNDLVEGGDDGDLYVFNRGDGDDIYSDQQTTPLLRAADMLIFGDDIAPQDLTYSRTGATGDDLLISVGGGGGSVAIANQFAYTSLGYNAALAPNSRIEAFAFGGYGDTFSSRDLQHKLIAQDTSSGDDTTRGFGDDDQFAASTGDDVLIGMDGADTYDWGAGAGNDTIREQARYIDVNVGLGGISLTVRADVVQFDASIDAAHLVFARDYDTDDLTITNAATGETLTVDGQFNSFQTGVLGPQWFDRVEWFAFADNSAYSWQDVEAMVTTGSAGNDRLRGDILADRMVGGRGDDLLSGGGGGDTYVFNAGDGHDTVFDDNWTLIGDGFLTADQTIDKVQLGEGIDPDDVAFTRNGSAITLTFGSSGDAITLQGQDDYIQTGVFGAIPTNRIEQVVFHDGTVWTWQDINQKMIATQTTAGNDVTEGFTLADRFEKSAGDDILRGGDSGDTYVFGVGAGHDRIEERVGNVLYGDDDSVEFDNSVSVADVSVARDGNDLILSLTSGDTLRTAGEFDLQTLYTWTDVENFRFADGTVWSKSDVQQKLLEATAGDDHLVGFWTDDTLDGGAGDDLLEGGDGSDTYVFGRGYGHDIIRETLTEANIGENDRLNFGAGIVLADLTFARSGNDLTITIADTGDTVTMEGQFNRGGFYRWNDVETFYFADGSSITNADVQQILLTGTPGNDTMVGYSTGDRLDGGAGDDLLQGGDGSDTYVFGPGYGHDVIQESVDNVLLGDDDTLEFSPGMTLADLGFSRNGDDLIVTAVATGDTMTIQGQFNWSSGYTWHDVENFVFSDGSSLTWQQVQQIILTGTPGDDVMIGFETGDTLAGGAGNDLLQGGGGADRYIYNLGDGDDVVDDYVNYFGSSGDTIVLGADIAPEDIRATVSPDNPADMLLTFAGNSGSITITGQILGGREYGIDRIEFADGTVWTTQDLSNLLTSSAATDGDDVIDGTSGPDNMFGGLGNDTLRGGYGNDLLDGGAGDDLLQGDDGNDTYVYSVGGGDDIISDYVNYYGSYNVLTLGSGIAPADLHFAPDSNDPSSLVVTFGTMAGSITLAHQLSWGREWGVDAVQFADGTQWDVNQLNAAYLADQVTAGDDTIDGTWYDDAVHGGAGNDLLRGNSGNDTLDGGTGNDRLEGGDGDDTYVYAAGGGDDVVGEYTYYWGSYNTLSLGSGITAADLRFAPASGDPSSMVITFANMAGSITLEHQISWGREYGVDAVQFSDGSQWDVYQLNAAYFAALKTTGSDTIEGTWYDDAINGGAGDDLLRGNSGNDTLDGGTGNDRLEGGDGDDIYVYAAGGGDDVIGEYTYYWGSYNTLKLGSGISAADLRFAPDSADPSNMVITFANMAGSITLEHQISWGREYGIDAVQFADGTQWDTNQLNAAYFAGLETSGADTIDGTWYGDTINGGAGNDLLRGNSGDDTLDGGTGNDRLEGGNGNDTFVYALGGGNDVINDYVYYWGSYDTLRFGAGITDDDLIVSRVSADPSDLRITFKYAEGSILIENQTWGDAGVERFEFADGTVLSDTDLDARLTGATDGDDVLTADPAGQELWALEGNDHLTGSPAADALYGQSGNDTLVGAGGGDLIDGGDGDDTLYGDNDGSGGLVASGGNLMVNGSFETSGTVVGGGGWGIANSDLPGWTKDNVQPFEQVYASGGVSPTDGTFWLDMDSAGGSGSNMSIDQTLAGLTEGDVYRLQFDEANRTSADNGGLEVYWNGVLVASYSNQHTDMQTRTLDLVAGAGANVLTFKGTGWEDNTGASLDNVRLYGTTTGESAQGGDLLTGGKGDDAIFGGGGDDVARFTGNSSDYLVTDNGDGTYSVADQTVDRDGTDTLTDVETFRFADGDFLAGDLAADGQWPAQGFAMRSMAAPVPSAATAASADMDRSEWRHMMWPVFDSPRLIRSIDDLRRDRGEAPASVDRAASLLSQSIASFDVVSAGDADNPGRTSADDRQFWLARHVSHLGPQAPAMIEA
jgi:Ca2+-binding RTX toxin-like protein